MADTAASSAPSAGEGADRQLDAATINRLLVAGITNGASDIHFRVGALYAMLTPFRKNGINLTSIESRPSRKRPWEYFFFVDCAGHLEDPKVARALAQLEPIATTVKILGSYPAAAPAGR